MTICRKCGTGNSDDRKFCSFCNELLVADPVEMAKREASEQKKLKKEQKKFNAKRKRWKRAPLLLIPIGILDLFNLLLCLDLALIGIGVSLGRSVALALQDQVGPTVELLGNLVYTNQLIEYAVRALEFLGAIGLFMIASVLVLVMIVRMIKWRRYCKHGSKKEQEMLATERRLQGMRDALGAQDQAASADVPRAQEVKMDLQTASVSYASLAALDGMRNNFVLPTPAKEIDCNALYGILARRLWEYDGDSVRRILSAMSCSRMLLCSAGAIDSASIFENLSGAFACKAEQFVCEAQEDEDGIARILLQKGQNGGVMTHTAFAKAMYTARFSPQNVCLAGVGGVGAGSVSKVFAPLTSYFKLPEGGTVLYLGTPASTAKGETPKIPEGVAGGLMTLPANLWMLCVLPEQDRVPCVEGEFGQHCAAIYLRNSHNVHPSEQDSTSDALPSVTAFENAVAAAENQHYLSDENWGVMDALEQQLQEACGVRLSNRTLRMFEKYTSVYIACGGRKVEALDNGIAAIIVPAYAEQLRVLAKREDGETLSALLERTVGRDRLPITVEVLTSMGLM